MWSSCYKIQTDIFTHPPISNFLNLYLHILPPSYDKGWTVRLYLRATFVLLQGSQTLLITQSFTSISILSFASLISLHLSPKPDKHAVIYLVFYRKEKRKEEGSHMSDIPRFHTPSATVHCFCSHLLENSWKGFCVLTISVFPSPVFSSIHANKTLASTTPAKRT